MLNHKIGLGLFSLLIVALIVPISSSYGLDTICSNSGQNGTQIQACMKAYLDYKKMNQDTDKANLQTIENMRNDMKANQITIDPNQTLNMILEKKVLAKQQWNQDYFNRVQYTQMSHSDMNALLAKYHGYLQEQSVPVKPVTCPAWHDDCNLNANPYTSMSMDGRIHTTLYNHTATPKPEFLHNPTGYIYNNSTVQNWHDLQVWLTEKIALKNSTK